MELAAFSLVDYKFDQVNLDFTNVKSDVLDISFKTSGLFNSIKSEFELKFYVCLRDNDKKEIISLQCISNFKFKEVLEFNQIPNYFYINSIAILFPYVRSYISILTTQANVRGIILPTYNLSSLEHEMKSNTVVTK